MKYLKILVTLPIIISLIAGPGYAQAENSAVKAPGGAMLISSPQKAIAVAELEEDDILKRMSKGGAETAFGVMLAMTGGALKGPYRGVSVQAYSAPRETLLSTKSNSNNSLENLIQRAEHRIEQYTGQIAEINERAEAIDEVAGEYISSWEAYDILYSGLPEEIQEMFPQLEQFIPSVDPVWTLAVEEREALIAVLEGAIHHSADYNHDWAISGTELNRVLAYWRVGAYHVEPFGYDGYAPGEGSQNGQPHDADTNGDWVISEEEKEVVYQMWLAGSYEPNLGYINVDIIKALLNEHAIPMGQAISAIQGLVNAYNQAIAALASEMAAIEEYINNYYQEIAEEYFLKIFNPGPMDYVLANFEIRDGQAICTFYFELLSSPVTITVDLGSCEPSMNENLRNAILTARQDVARGFQVDLTEVNIGSVLDDNEQSYPGSQEDCYFIRAFIGIGFELKYKYIIETQSLELTSLIDSATGTDLLGNANHYLAELGHENFELADWGLGDTTNNIVEFTYKLADGSMITLNVNIGTGEVWIPSDYYREIAEEYLAEVFNPDESWIMVFTDYEDKVKVTFDLLDGSTVDVWVSKISLDVWMNNDIAEAITSVRELMAERMSDFNFEDVRVNGIESLYFDPMEIDPNNPHPEHSHIIKANVDNYEITIGYVVDCLGQVSMHLASFVDSKTGVDYVEKGVAFYLGLFNSDNNHGGVVKWYLWGSDLRLAISNGQNLYLSLGFDLKTGHMQVDKDLIRSVTRSRLETALGLGVGYDEVCVTSYDIAHMVLHVYPSVVVTTYIVNISAGGFDLKYRYDPKSQTLTLTSLVNAEGENLLQNAIDHLFEVVNPNEFKLVDWGYEYTTDGSIGFTFELRDGSRVTVSVDTLTGTPGMDQRLIDAVLNTRSDIAKRMGKDIKDVHINGLRHLYTIKCPGGPTVYQVTANVDNYTLTLECAIYNNIYFNPLPFKPIPGIDYETRGIIQVEEYYLWKWYSVKLTSFVDNATGKDYVKEAIDQVSDLFNPETSDINVFSWSMNEDGQLVLQMSLRYLKEGPYKLIFIGNLIPVTVDLNTGTVTINEKMVDAVVKSREEISEKLGISYGDVHVNDIRDWWITGEWEDYPYDGHYIEYKGYTLTIVASGFGLTYNYDLKTGDVTLASLVNRETGTDLLGNANHYLAELGHENFELADWGLGDTTNNIVEFTYKLADGSMITLNVNIGTGEVWVSKDYYREIAEEYLVEIVNPDEYELIVIKVFEETIKFTFGLLDGSTVDIEVNKATGALAMDEKLKEAALSIRNYVLEKTGAAFENVHISKIGRVSLIMNPEIGHYVLTTTVDGLDNIEIEVSYYGMSEDGVPLYELRGVFNTAIDKNLFVEAGRHLRNVFNPSSVTLDNWEFKNDWLYFYFKLPSGDIVRVCVNSQTGWAGIKMNEEAVKLTRQEVAERMAGGDITKVHIDKYEFIYNTDAQRYLDQYRFTATVDGYDNLEIVMVYGDEGRLIGEPQYRIRLESLVNRETGTDLYANANEFLAGLGHENFDLEAWKLVEEGTDAIIKFGFALEDGTPIILNVNINTGEVWTANDCYQDIAEEYLMEIANPDEYDLGNWTIEGDNIVFTFNLADDSAVCINVNIFTGAASMDEQMKAAILDIKRRVIFAVTINNTMIVPEQEIHINSITAIYDSQNTMIIGYDIGVAVRDLIIHYEYDLSTRKVHVESFINVKTGQDFYQLFSQHVKNIFNPETFELFSNNSGFPSGWRYEGTGPRANYLFVHLYLPETPGGSCGLLYLININNGSIRLAGFDWPFETESLNARQYIAERLDTDMVEVHVNGLDSSEWGDSKSHLYFMSADQFKITCKVDGSVITLERIVNKETNTDLLANANEFLAGLGHENLELADWKLGDDTNQDNIIEFTYKLADGTFITLNVDIGTGEVREPGELFEEEDPEVEEDPEIVEDNPDDDTTDDIAQAEEDDSDETSETPEEGEDSDDADSGDTDYSDILGDLEAFIRKALEAGQPRPNESTGGSPRSRGSKPEDYPGMGYGAKLRWR